MAGRRLVGYTAVRDDDGIVHSFGPGDDLPDWAAKRITNPKLWGGDAPSALEEKSPEDGDGGGKQQQPAPEPPPKGGKGSGLEEWLAYAKHFPQVDLGEDPNRDDVIDALDNAGVRTE